MIRLIFIHTKTHKRIYGILILRSIHTLLKQKKSNPYTREEFRPLVYDQVGGLIGHIQSLGHTIEIEDYKPKNLQKIVQRKIIDITVTMTQCGYTFQEQWLPELPKSKLIHLYRLLEDMWNYRVQMTREQEMLYYTTQWMASLIVR